MMALIDAPRRQTALAAGWTHYSILSLGCAWLTFHVPVTDVSSDPGGSCHGVPGGFAAWSRCHRYFCPFRQYRQITAKLLHGMVAQYLPPADTIRSNIAKVGLFTGTPDLLLWGMFSVMIAAAFW